MPTLVLVFGRAATGLSDPGPLPDARLVVTARPVALALPDGFPLRLAGSWSLSARDPRFGGWSDLALSPDGRFLAISDKGSWLRLDLPRPAAGRQRLSATIGDLPRRLRPGASKLSADAESLARDPAGRGWWIGFEHNDRLQLFDETLDTRLATIDLRQFRWPRNLGPEGLVARGGELAVYSEGARAPRGVVRWRDGRFTQGGIADLPGRSSSAAALGEETLLLRRTVSRRGFSSWLASPEGGALALPLGWRDNAEGVAVIRRHDKSARIWILTDDNFQWPLRTLLVAFDAPPGWRPGGGSEGSAGRP